MKLSLFAQNSEEADLSCSSITTYLLNENKPSPMMIVCPGGGYNMRAEHEGKPVAEWLNSIGISAVVLNYRVTPAEHNMPLDDAQRAIRLVRYHAKDWNIDPNRIGILGFSAGGHLAATAATHYDSGNPNHTDEVEHYSCRPNVAVLCYPVISFREHMHSGSKKTLLGEQPNAELMDYYSNELHVNADTPPTFLWHTADDATVPVENSIMFAQALKKSNVPHELHVFETGVHGLGLAEEHEQVRIWPTLCAAWLKTKEF